MPIPVLTDPIKRKQLAELVVWGANRHLPTLTKSQIEARLEKVLERINRAQEKLETKLYY